VQDAQCLKFKSF